LFYWICSETRLVSEQVYHKKDFIFLQVTGIIRLVTESTSRIISAILAVPPGKVSCYRDIALAAGLPAGAARQVVRVLHSMTETYGLPWHRIIRADGCIALESCRGGGLQAKLLRAEGVRVSKTGWVDLSRWGVFRRGSHEK
jgi:methylated-DNA-protein-cysteine methyltransferase-like protein